MTPISLYSSAVPGNGCSLVEFCKQLRHPYASFLDPGDRWGGCTLLTHVLEVRRNAPDWLTAVLGVPAGLMQINVYDRRGRYPLWVAAMNRDREAVRLLVAKGASYRTTVPIFTTIVNTGLNSYRSYERKGTTLCNWMVESSEYGMLVDILSSDPDPYHAERSLTDRASDGVSVLRRILASPNAGKLAVLEQLQPWLTSDSISEPLDGCKRSALRMAIEQGDIGVFDFLVSFCCEADPSVVKYAMRRGVKWVKRLPMERWGGWCDFLPIVYKSGPRIRDYALPRASLDDIGKCGLETLRTHLCCRALAWRVLNAGPSHRVQNEFRDRVWECVLQNSNIGKMESAVALLWDPSWYVRCLEKVRYHPRIKKLFHHMFKLAYYEARRLRYAAPIRELDADTRSVVYEFAGPSEKYMKRMIFLSNNSFGSYARET